MLGIAWTQIVIKAGGYYSNLKEKISSNQQFSFPQND